MNGEDTKVRKPASSDCYNKRNYSSDNYSGDNYSGDNNRNNSGDNNKNNSGGNRNNSGGNNCDNKKVKRNIWLIYFCLYLAGAAAFRMIVYKQGKSLVQIYDAKDQYLPFLKYLNLYYREFIRSLLHGKFHIKMFDYSLGFGMDPIRVLSYYGLADPLSFPVIFFKQTNVLQYFQFIVQFRPFLAGLAFIGMCFHFRKVNYMVPFCALFYLCSGWALYAFSVHPFFVNFMILLPMIIVGIDNILYGKSPALFIVSVFLAGCIGFYFLFMVSVSMLIFAVVRLVCRRKEILPFDEEKLQDRLKEGPDAGTGHRKPERGLNSSPAFRAAGIVAKSFGYYIVGLAMTGCILLPSLSGVMDSLRGVSSNLPENMFVYPVSTLVRLYSRAVMLSPGCNSLSFSMTGLFSLVFVLSKRRKDETGILALAGIVLWFLPVWSVFMSGIAVPNYRWFFALSLLAMYLCTDIPEYLAEASTGQKAVFLIAGAMAIAASFADYAPDAGFHILRVLAAVTGGILLIVSFSGCGESVRRGICIALICVQCLVNTAAFFSPVWFGKVNEYTNRGVENRIDQSPDAAGKKVPDYDNKYRTESGEINIYNTMSVLQIPSVRTYASIIPESVSSFVVEMENNTMSTPFSISGFDRRAALMQMCSVGYFVSVPEDKKEIPFGYEEVCQKGKTRVYHNSYAPAPGYVYYKTFDPADLEQRNGIEKQSLLLQGAVVEESTIPAVSTASVETGVTEIPYEVKDLNGVVMEGDTLSVDESVEEPWIDVTMTLPENSEIYARLNGFDGGEKLLFRFVLEGEEKNTLSGRDRNWAYGQQNFSALIERTKAGEEKDVSCRIYLSGAHKCTLHALEFFAYDLNLYEKTASELSENSMADVRFGTNSITGTLFLAEEGLLCVPVPYSKGWSAYVDGEKRQCLQANYLCSSVIVPKGQHEVTFRYLTPGLIPGLAVSIMGLIAFLTICLRRRQTH